MVAGLSLNGRRSSSRCPVSSAVAIAAVHAHINGAFSAYPRLHNLPGLITHLDDYDDVYHAEDESPHDADEQSQLPESPHDADEQSPQGSSSNGCYLCMDQLVCVSLFPYPLLLVWSGHVECVRGDLIRVELYIHL